VQRVKDQEQQRVFGEMHEGEFLGALQLTEKAGRLHWTGKQDDTLRAMVEHYTGDVAAAPDKRRFMFAFSNAEVDTLNDLARAIYKQRGDLGADVSLQTKDGPQTFATGDRVMFSGGGRTAAEKRAGLINGNAGTITEIDTTGPKPCVTVQLDAAKGQEPQSITFTVGDDAKAGEFNKFKLGYAGTIYKGQGATLDQTYVCHSSPWKSSAAYVALTRHRENVEIFAATNTVRGMDYSADRATFGQAAQEVTFDPAAFAAAERAHDLETMARGMGRSENKRAATACQIDDAHLARATFGQAALEATDIRPTVQALPMMQEPLPESAPPIVAPVALIEQRGVALEVFTGHETSRAVDGIANALGSAVSGVARFADGVADFAAKGIEALADLFGGASPPPPVTHHTEAAPPPAPEPVAPSRGPVDPVDAFLAVERQQRAAMRALDAVVRVTGPPDIPKEQDEGQTL
jgi:hypothetical protein